MSAVWMHVEGGPNPGQFNAADLCCLFGRQTRQQIITAWPVEQPGQPKLIVAMRLAAQASAATSKTSAIASIRRAAFASRVRAAVSRRSAAGTSNRVIATVIAVPYRTVGTAITSCRAVSIHMRVNGLGR
jgi:hypothetical protein